MFRRVFIPGSPLLAAVAIVKSDEKSADVKKEKSLICKPSQLPIYTSLVDSEPKIRQQHKPSKVSQTIEESVRVVRVEVEKVTDMCEMQKGKVDRMYVDFLKDTQHYRNYLREEKNTFPRVGAIAVSSLAGVVLGVRGGFFKKLFYASLTGSSMAAVCYPREARVYAKVAYNFAYGIKPGDEKQKDLPKFPTTFGELSDNVVSLSNMAYVAVTKTIK